MSTKASNWIQPERALQRDSEFLQNKAVLLNGQLIRKPTPPEAPRVTYESWETLPATVFSPCSVTELLQKCPPGVPYADIKIETDKTGRVTLLARRMTNNLFYEEEMKVYHARLAVYELEKKVWEKQLDSAHNFARAESEKLAEQGGRHKIDPEEDKQSRDITRDWLQRVKEFADNAGPDSLPKASVKSMSANVTVDAKKFAETFGFPEEVKPAQQIRPTIIQIINDDDGLPPTREESKKE